ncbi:MAG: type II secretion system F family protein [Desulfobacteraceae bacterium]|nr:type II secretion system F family protein [Desulfobacteraceae bacterium]
MELLSAGIIIFLASVVIIELLKIAWKNMHSVQRIKIRKRLQKYAALEQNNSGLDIVRKQLMSKTPAVHAVLRQIPGMRRLDRLILQANGAHLLDFYLLWAVILTGAGFVPAKIFLHKTFLAVVIALAFGLLPFLHLIQLKQKRMEKFKNQLPEGLEMISRALKAGHAFTSGMKLAADQFKDPLGPEFAETLDEINFGVSVPDALRSLAKRIDCQEIKYFVVAVILQRETGGNLAEIIESLAHLIREKFKLMGKVQALSAEGKLSAVILVMLPFFIVFYLRMVNAEYLGLLFTDPMGRMMLAGAGIMMAAGIFVIRTMIKIKF